MVVSLVPDGIGRHDTLPMRSTTQSHDRAVCVVPAPPQVDLTAVIGAKVVDRELALAQANR
jgi:hypothetical protein